MTEEEFAQWREELATAKKAMNNRENVGVGEECETRRLSARSCISSGG